MSEAQERSLTDLAPQENYDAFFDLVDAFLWDSDLPEERQFGRFRRGENYNR